MVIPKRIPPIILALLLWVGASIGFSPNQPQTGIFSDKTEDLWLVQDVYLKAIPVLPVQGQVLATIVEPENPIIDCLIQKESSGNQGAIGKAGEIGILQFMPSTWELFNKKYGFDLSINNPDDQIFLAQKMLEENPLNIGHWSTAYLCQP